MNVDFQRFEVRATGYPGPGTRTIGWSNDLDAADRMAAAIRQAPGCTATEIFDREQNRFVQQKAAQR